MVLVLVLLGTSRLVLLPCHYSCSTALPAPSMIMEGLPLEKFTEYRSSFGRTDTDDDRMSPDIKPISKGRYKYYQGADKFSYNSQHNNKAY